MFFRKMKSADGGFTQVRIMEASYVLRGAIVGEMGPVPYYPSEEHAAANFVGSIFKKYPRGDWPAIKILAVTELDFIPPQFEGEIVELFFEYEEPFDDGNPDFVHEDE